MLPRLARTAAVAAVIVGLAVLAATLLDPTLPQRLLRLSPTTYVAIGGVWLAATIAADRFRSRGARSTVFRHRARGLTLPPLRRR